MPEFQEKQKILFCGKQKPDNYYHNNKKQLKYSVNYVRLVLFLPASLKNSNSLCEAKQYFCTGVAMFNNCISRRFYHLTKI